MERRIGGGEEWRELIEDKESMDVMKPSVFADR